MFKTVMDTDNNVVKTRSGMGWGKGQKDWSGGRVGPILALVKIQSQEHRTAKST